MAKPNRMKDIETEQVEALITLIPRLLNELGTMRAVAIKLGTTEATIWLWCQSNGVRKQYSWVVAEHALENGAA